MCWLTSIIATWHWLTRVMTFGSFLSHNHATCQLVVHTSTEFDTQVVDSSLDGDKCLITQPHLKSVLSKRHIACITWARAPWVLYTLAKKVFVIQEYNFVSTLSYKELTNLSFYQWCDKTDFPFHQCMTSPFSIVQVLQQHILEYRYCIHLYSLNPLIISLLVT